MRTKHMGSRPAIARNGAVRLRTAAGLLAVVVLSGSGAVGAPRAAPELVGTVTGTVRLLAAQESRSAALSPYARTRYRPPARPQVVASLPETVVVYLRPEGAAPAAAAGAPAV